MPSRVAGILPARDEGVSPSCVAGVPPASCAVGREPRRAVAELQSQIDGSSARRAIERIVKADLILLLETRATPDWCHGKNVLPVWPKADAAPPPCDYPGPAVSARTGLGLDELAAAILRALGLGDFDPAVPRAFTARQAELLSSAADALRRNDPHSAAAVLEKLLEDL